MKQVLLALSFVLILPPAVAGSRHSQRSVRSSVSTSGRAMAPRRMHNRRSRIRHCASNNYQFNSCRVNFNIDSIYLDRQFSQAPCTPGHSFGTNGQRIWVNHGCRANFRVAGYRGGQYGNNGYGYGYGYGNGYGYPVRGRAYWREQARRQFGPGSAFDRRIRGWMNDIYDQYRPDFGFGTSFGFGSGLSGLGGLSGFYNPYYYGGGFSGSYGFGNNSGDLSCLAIGCRPANNPPYYYGGYGYPGNYGYTQFQF